MSICSSKFGSSVFYYFIVVHLFLLAFLYSQVLQHRFGGLEIRQDGLSVEFES